MIRVLQVNSVFGVGSTGRIVKDIHDVLISNGNESYIVYGRGQAENSNHVFAISNYFDTLVHLICTRLFDYHGLLSNKSTNKLIRLIDKIQPDIIHLHNIHGYFLNYQILFNYLKIIETPVVWTLHDCWSFTGHCAYFDYVDCYKWVKLCHHCPQSKSYPASFFYDRSSKNYKQKHDLFTNLGNMVIITPSVWLSNIVKDSFLNKYPIMVINNGIDLDCFKKSEGSFISRYNLTDKFIILGVASGWDKRKGFDYFLDLSNRLETDEIIILVGIEDNQMNLLNDRIIGINRTDSIQELVDVYSNSSVFVNPTLEDNFPTTNLEALACGLPIVTFSTGGSIESVDYNTGRIVEKGDRDALYEAIKEIKSLGKNHFSKACIEKAQICYNKKDRFNDYVKLYYEMVKSNDNCSC